MNSIRLNSKSPDYGSKGQYRCPVLAAGFGSICSIIRSGTKLEMSLGNSQMSLHSHTKLQNINK